MDTRQKIFDSAMEAFAAQGYKKTTIRDICRRAEVNVAAVNYHFSGKAELYSRVFEYLFDKRMHAESIRDAADVQEAERFLKDWIKTIVPINKNNKFRFLKRKIMLQEMFDSSELFPLIVDKYIRPDVDILVNWLRLLLPEVPEDRLMLIFFSLLAKCIFYFEHENLVLALVGDRFIDNNVDMIAGQIYLETMINGR